MFALLAIKIAWIAVEHFSAGQVLFALAPTPGDPVTIESSTINSDGDTLTVVFSGPVTITNATGCTIEFDNYAERVLSYSSGTGTDTIVFAIAANPDYTDIETDNDAAPVGSVATWSYDADTGNISGMSDANDNAITNNSTVIPDPDIPGNLPHPSLPANWNAAADHTPADGTALQTLLNDFGGTLQAGDVIDLDADVDYGTIIIPADVQGNSSNWIIIRSDEYASLPAYGLRVTESDEQYMATMSRVPSQPSHLTLSLNGGDGVPGCSYIRFIGIKVAMTGSYGTDISAMAGTQTGGFSHTADELPHHIGFDRCSFTCDSATVEVRNGLQFDADDSFIVGCVFHNFYGAENNGSSAIWTYNGHRILVDNNYLESQSTPFFLGDNTPGSISDVAFTRNHTNRPVEWADTGTYGTAKAGGIETKTGLRILIEDNVFQNHFAASWEVLNFKVDGATNEESTRHVTIRRCKLDECVWSVLIHVTGSSPHANAGPNTDFLVEDLLAFSAARTCRFRFSTADDSRYLQRIQVRNCTILGDMRSTGFGDGPGESLALTDNIICGTLGYFDNEAGSAGFNNGWDDAYDGQYNSFLAQSISAYDNDASPAPLGTLDNNQFPANLAAIGFTDEANDDFSLDPGSDLIDVSSVGGPLGYDSATCDPIWANAITGDWD